MSVAGLLTEGSQVADCVPAEAEAVSRRLGRRGQRVPVAAAAVLLAAGALALWGPVGLGNGPLNAGVGATQGGSDPRGGPVGFIIPVTNSGRAPAVVDGIGVVGVAGYASPHVLALDVLASSLCAGAWPVRHTRQGFVLAGCGGPAAGPLIGHAFGHGVRLPAAAEVAAPLPGRCWVMTKIVVHYHVGIRHYTATDPYELAECFAGAQVSAAMTAAQASS